MMQMKKGIDIKEITLIIDFRLKIKQISYLKSYIKCTKTNTTGLKK